MLKDSYTSYVSSIYIIPLISVRSNGSALAEYLLDIIRDNYSRETYSSALYRNIVLKLCKPHTVSITRSSK
jgi:hypothetical protein